jgi:predicted amidohydrolase YtcJ
MRQRAELIIEGRIATLDGASGFGWQEALAVSDGRVMAAGPMRELEALAGPRTARWRLADEQLVMPGITDAHLHLMLMVLAESQLDLTATPDLEAVLHVLGAAHRERLARGDRDGWLLGHGWSLHGLGRWPDAAMLEEACPGRPVALYAHDHHSRWVSATALRLAGIDAQTADPEAGIIRRDESGRPTGILHETATGLVDAVIPDPPIAELEGGLERQAAALLAMGVTGCHDPGELSSERRVVRGPVFYRALARDGKLPLRVHSSIRAPQIEAAIELGLRSGQGVDVAEMPEDPGRRRMAEHYRMGWLKLFADGSLGSRSAALLEPYTDAAERPPTGSPRGMYLGSPEELQHDLRRTAAAGISGQVHAIGDAAVRTALDLLADMPAMGLARRVEHAQLVHPDDQPRFGRLGIAASVQPVHLRSDATPARAAWGNRSENAFPLASLVADGALIPFGTDAPVEPSDPWPGLAVAVARRDPERPADEPLGARHALDLARALRAACLDPALVAGQADLGRLTSGYRADLLVVPAAGFREPVDAAELARTRPLATMLDGQVVYRDDDFSD